MHKHTLCLALMLMLGVTWANADLPFRQHRYETLKNLPCDSNAILFVGNSITDMFPWHEAFCNLPEPYHICNRGVSGALSSEVLANIGWMVREHPYKLLLMVGTNDLGSGISPKQVADNIDSTLALVHQLSPRTQVILHSILPSTSGSRTLAAERETNRLLAQTAAKHGATFIDLYDKMMGITTDTAYSLDGLHLTARAYGIWCQEIAPKIHPQCRCALQLPSMADRRLWGSASMRIGYYGALPSTPRDILVVGGEMAKCGEWNELTGNARMLNRGIGWGAMTAEQERQHTQAALAYIEAQGAEYEAIYVLADDTCCPPDQGKVYYLPLRKLLDAQYFDGPYLNSLGYSQAAQLINQSIAAHTPEERFVECAHTVYAIAGTPFAQYVHTNVGISIEQLPAGLEWMPRKGMIAGTVDDTGTYTYYIVSNHSRDTIRLSVRRQLPQSTPFMGLLTWNIFEDEISDQRVRLLADAMVDLGLEKAGYRYLCLDDRWATHDRTADGHLRADSSKFPQGLNTLADYLHQRRLRFGIYSDAGIRTCSGQQPGSLGFEAVDAQDFARWGFDLLKYDYCYAAGKSADTAQAAYTAMARQLAKHTKPDFIYYMCEWGERSPWLWGAEAGATCWRATADTRDCWTNPTYRGGVMDNIEVFNRIWPYSGINRFSDADMLMCGLHGSGKSSNAGTQGQGMTQHEYRTQMILWCMWSSPLTLCLDITTLYDGHSRCGTGIYNPFYKEDLALITNPHLIALDQDPLGLAARPAEADSDHLVLVKPLAGGDVAISITNLSDAEADISLRLDQMPELDPAATYRALDLMQGETTHCLSPTSGHLDASLASHATLVWRLTTE
ncbi:MAG: GDSL-type esterase/lipase family protein [Bacteroidales bacterium]|nr:GDSL-type esterase/lipase family protein [Bacteroidales bacterium]